MKWGPTISSSTSSSTSSSSASARQLGHDHPLRLGRREEGTQSKKYYPSVPTHLPKKGFSPLPAEYSVSSPPREKDSMRRCLHMVMEGGCKHAGAIIASSQAGGAAASSAKTHFMQGPPLPLSSPIHIASWAPTAQTSSAPFIRNKVQPTSQKEKASPTDDEDHKILQRQCFPHFSLVASLNGRVEGERKGGGGEETGDEDKARRSLAGDPKGASLRGNGVFLPLLFSFPPPQATTTTTRVSFSTLQRRLRRPIFSSPPARKKMGKEGAQRHKMRRGRGFF